MDQKSNTQPADAGAAPVTDDQALADVLAGMNKKVSAIEEPASGNGKNPTDEMQFEETPVQTDAIDTDNDEAAPAAEEPATIDPMANLAGNDTLPPVADTTAEMPAPEEAVTAPAPEVTAPAIAPEPVFTPSTPVSTAPMGGELDSIKKDALEELRPLVDRLDLPPEEKFDTLLLIIRSTDDKTLVNAAHEAAKNIPDETKRANALLDIIKEIDYFANQPAA